MKVYIVGAGAVGTSLGDLLKSVNVDVTSAPRNLSDVTPGAAAAAVGAVTRGATGSQRARPR